jgi:hypothetical protein
MQIQKEEILKQSNRVAGNGMCVLLSIMQMLQWFESFSVEDGVFSPVFSPHDQLNSQLR